MLRFKIAVFIGLVIRQIIKTFRLGYGGVWPGNSVQFLCPQSLVLFLARVQRKVVYVAGTNGKTTTTRLLADLLGEKKTVFSLSGANCENGLITAFLEYHRQFRKNPPEYAVFETDEKALVKILKKCPPSVLICLNVFRDQLDRYGEVDIVKKQWKEAFQMLPSSTQFIFNGDDPFLYELARDLKQQVSFFGLSESQTPEKKISAPVGAVDSHFCPYCQNLLEYKKVYFSHLGDYACKTCDFVKPEIKISSDEWPAISPYVHDRYNALAAICCALNFGKTKSEIISALKEYQPVFGRGEQLHLKEGEVLFLLSKNAVSFTESLSIVCELEKRGMLGAVLFALNDQPFDGCDVSWIWDADMHLLQNLAEIPLFVTGKRAYDLAVCFNYFIEPKAGQFFVSEDVLKTTQHALKAITPGKILCVIPSYTALFQIREWLVGKNLFLTPRTKVG